jgi:hypothetical protein
MLPVGFEPSVPASAQPKAHALHRAATGIGIHGYHYARLPDGSTESHQSLMQQNCQSCQIGYQKTHNLYAS